MSEKVITSAALFKAAVKAASGIAFFETHHARLVSSDMPREIQSLALAVKAREALPTPSLVKLRSLLTDHLVAEAERAAARKASGVKRSPGASKRVTVPLPYMATVFDHLGRVLQVMDTNGEPKALTKNLPSLSAAESYISRNVCAVPNTHGEIVFDGRATVYDRDRCFAIAFPAKPMALHRSPKRESALKWTGKAEQSSVKFSRG